MPHHHGAAFGYPPFLGEGIGRLGAGRGPRTALGFELYNLPFQALDELAGPLQDPLLYLKFLAGDEP